MKKLNLVACGILSLAILGGFTSCNTEEPKKADTEIERGVRPTDRQLRNLLEDAARRAAQLKSNAISPNTRSEVTYAIEEGAIQYDESKDQATVPVTLRWKARKAILADGKHDFEMRGTLTVSLGFRPDAYPAIFLPSYANEITKEIGKGDASSTLSFDVYKK